MMKIRLSTPADLTAMLAIYDYARAFMRKTGNPNQWVGGYPAKALLEEDIALGRSFVLTDEAGQVCGTFVFIFGEEPTYLRIDDGHWLNDLPYGVIHRLAGNGAGKGILPAVMDFCAARCGGNLRVDTHADNRIMGRLLEKNGFTRCGVIYLEDGAPRIAYQRTE